MSCFSVISPTICAGRLAFCSSSRSFQPLSKPRQAAVRPRSGGRTKFPAWQTAHFRTGRKARCGFGCADRRRYKAVVSGLPRTRQDRHSAAVDTAGQPPAHHLVEVAEEAEPGHIRGRMNIIASTYLGGRLVQGRHGGHGGVHGAGGSFAHAVGRADEAHTQRLGKDELVAGLPVSLAVRRRGSTRPVTDRPYFTPVSAMEWPPARMPPASATFSAPPRKISPRMFRSMLSGKQTRFSAVFTSPPIA